MKRFVLEIMGAALLAGGLAFSQSATAEGTAPSRVEIWLVNPAGQVDGVLLHDGRSFYFSPEIGRTATLSVHITDPVRIDVENGQRWLVDQRDDSRVELLAPVARGGGPSSALSRITARGEIRTWVRGPEGTISGFVLSTGEQVRVPSGVSGRIVAAVRLGDIVTVRGLGTRGDFGTGIDALSVVDGAGRTLLQR